ncbi:GNAT family N-acetyltransferase [Pedobacter antarcticus]|uniref:GNAT family N-acetyltransferase n=1 Tax=Pedobacter antarcticus TaxID=34086 RepID=UPI0008837679|nr:GNAT family N-acetyltransferase [Pedobacter antarcticus]SDL69344.1 Protein N-acetyltransferase, RimJ/RimL family [Pedobacter antarcticus]
MWSQIKIETKRLNLISVSDKYKDEILIEFTPQITRYMPYTPNGNEGEVQDFLDKAKLGLINGTDFVFAAIQKDSDVFLGCCGIHNITEDSIELGLWLKSDVHGRGLGTEIIEGLINFIEEKLKFNYLIYPVDKDNAPSRRIPEKLGFSIFGEYKKAKDENTFLNIIEYRKYCNI